jgi:hypothetical protein
MAMSATTQKKGQKAGGVQNGFTTAGQRHLKYGTNVLIVCLAALFIVVFLNVISFRKHWRKDMAVVGAYQPSERTKRIIDTLKDPITLTSVYTGRDEENNRDKFFPSVEDFLRELQLYAPAKVKVQDVDTDAAKAELLARIQGKYSGQAKEYRALIDEFGKFAAEVNAAQGPDRHPARLPPAPDGTQRGARRGEQLPCQLPPGRGPPSQDDQEPPGPHRRPGRGQAADQGHRHASLHRGPGTRSIRPSTSSRRPSRPGRRICRPSPPSPAPGRMSSSKPRRNG